MQKPARRRLAKTVPEIRLTDALPRVVTRRHRRNRVWMLLSAPFRLVGAFWQWLMESRPSTSHRLRREPPGFN